MHRHSIQSSAGLSCSWSLQPGLDSMNEKLPCCSEISSLTYLQIFWSMKLDQRRDFAFRVHACRRCDDLLYHPDHPVETCTHTHTHAVVLSLQRLHRYEACNPFVNLGGEVELSFLCRSVFIFAQRDAGFGGTLANEPHAHWLTPRQSSAVSQREYIG